MNVNNYNLKPKSNYNLDIIKSMPINPSEFSIRIPPQEDIQPSSHSFQLNKKNIINNNNNNMLPSNNNIENQLSSSSNSNNSENFQKTPDEKEIFKFENNLSDSNYNSDENNNINEENEENISNRFKNFELNDDKDKLNLIKKQNDKIDELFNLLESRDKEINSLQNENNSLYKYKNNYKIAEQNNINKTNLLNKYAQALHLGKQELKNTTTSYEKPPRNGALAASGSENQGD